MTATSDDRCRSYNGGFGSVPEVPLPNPFEDGRARSIDACIAPVIRRLWDAGVPTVASCCGHGGRIGAPSIVLSESVEEYSYVRDLIGEVDSRWFELSQWRRVIV